MEKKIYSKPAFNVVAFEMNEIVCASVKSVEGGDLNYGGGSTGAARSNDRGGIWDED